MSLFTNLSLKTKLIAGFTTVAMIACFVGAAGWWSLSLLHSDLNNVVNTIVPSVQHLSEIETSAERFKAARRALLNPNIDLAEYRKMIDNASKAQAAYDAACKKYASLKLTSDEETVWNAFLATSDQWRQTNDKYFTIAGEYEKILVECVSPLEPNPGDYFHNCLDMKSEARNGLLELAKQSQAWSNLVLRGDNPSDYTKYLAAIEARDDSIRLNLATLKNLAPLIGFKVDSIEKTEKIYGEVIEKYHAALKGMKTRNAAGLASLANQLHSADLASVAALESLSQELEKRTNRIRAIPGSLLLHSMNSCLPFERNLREILEGLIQYRVKESDETATRSKQNAVRGNLVIIAGTITSFILALALGIVVSWNITRPIKDCVGFTGLLAQGDFSKEVPEVLRKRGDEMGDLARAFHTMVGNTRELLKGMMRNTQTVASSATELSATATQLASGAEETTNQSAQVAAAAEQMSTNMGGMAAATEQMSTNIKVVASAIEELTSSISEVSKSAERAAGVADNAAQLVSTSNSQIGELGGAADEIGKVIEVIQDIAEQTNLLALNATIEAARAGDAGKGFAVVATEVKELAKQTASATEDIRKRIKGIQGSSGRAVKSISDISDVVKQVNELSRMIASAVEEQSITTKEIARNMVQSSTAAQMVSRGVAESATATHEITRNIVGVDQAARQSAQGAAQTQTTGRELSSVAEQLQGLVGQFKV
ncbi:MAG: methyl-accepting chemotaxis protein [Planctomycetota bacterium]